MPGTCQGSAGSHDPNHGYVNTQEFSPHSPLRPRLAANTFSHGMRGVCGCEEGRRTVSSSGVLGLSSTGKEETRLSQGGEGGRKGGCKICLR